MKNKSANQSKARLTNSERAIKNLNKDLSNYKIGKVFKNKPSDQTPNCRFLG
jgi:hypothetical protein